MAFLTQLRVKKQLRSRGRDRNRRCGDHHVRPAHEQPSPLMPTLKGGDRHGEAGRDQTPPEEGPGPEAGD